MQRTEVRSAPLAYALYLRDTQHASEANGAADRGPSEVLLDAARILAEPFTTAVGADVADAEPPAFFAVTVTRMVLPESPPVMAWVSPVAPEIEEQEPPRASQFDHTYEKLVGEFLQLPVAAVSVLPTFSVPLIVGTAVETGGATADGGAGCEVPFLRIAPVIGASETKLIVDPSAATNGAPSATF